MMRKKMKYCGKKCWVVAAVALFLMSGCTSPNNDTHINVNESQLYGKWQEQSTQVYWRYNGDGTGVTWDEGEDISEEESNLTYSWTVKGDELTHVFTGAQDNQYVPKVYTITEISESTMEWRDDYGMTKSLEKVDGYGF